MSLLRSGNRQPPAQEALQELTREQVIEKFGGTTYSEKFRKIVLELFDMDYASEDKNRKWVGLMFASNVMSEEHGKKVPYEVCIVDDVNGTMKGFCMNEKLDIGHAMPETECIELWAMLLEEYGNRTQVQER